MCVYVLVAIVKKRLGIEASLYEMLQILSLTLFEKTELFSLFQSPVSQSPAYGGNRGKSPGCHGAAGARMSSASRATAGASGTLRRSPR